MNQNFIDFMHTYSSQKMAVAVSGGVDSVCLLHWLAALNLNVVALHVNHGLRTAADTESEYVESLCRDLGVPCHVFHWSDAKPTTGLEAAARAARYKMMTDFCRENDIKYLLVAHQADDQIETFLMNLGRGSGLAGLAAMQPVTSRDGIIILRPLLGVYRTELQTYCDQNNIKYFVDEMNGDDKYTRVRIRQNRHVLSEKLGISDDRILLAIENLSRARAAMDANIADMVATSMFGDYALFSDSFLFDQAYEIRLKFLGTLIQRIGGNDYQPRLNSLRIALDKLGTDTQFTLGHCTVRRLGGKILIVREGTKTSFRKRNGKQKTKTKIQ